MVGMFGTRNGEEQYVMMLQSQLLGCCSHCPQIGMTSKHEYVALPTWNGGYMFICYVCTFRWIQCALNYCIQWCLAKSSSVSPPGAKAPE